MSVLKLIRKMQYSKNKGFTLIELLVVISIIGFLAAIVMSSLQTAREKSLDTQIKGDMAQIKNALELYATSNNYTYPLISQNKNQYAQNSPKEYVSEYASTGNTFFSNMYNSFIGIFRNTVYAQGEGVRDEKCVNYDRLSDYLVPKFIGNLPRHPLDNGEDVCYQYFSNQNGSTGVIYAPLITDTYSNGYSRQVGIAFGASDIDSLKSICALNIDTYPSGSTPFPLFAGVGNTRCDGSITDIVLGITNGGGDIPTASSCSIPGYDSEEECETDYSNCSDPYYTDSEQCTANGIYVGRGCSDSDSTDVYGSEELCTGAGYTNPGYCSDGTSNYSSKEACESAGSTPGSCDGGASYTSQMLCESAGYTNPGYCSDGTGTYTTKESCEDAGVVEGHCSDGSGTYTDYSSCVTATVFTPGYCSDGSGTYDSRDSCEAADGGDIYTWTDEQTNPAGYTWTWNPGYGYTWTNDEFVPYGYIWTRGTDPFGYTWTNDEFVSYGYEWSDGAYTPNIWTNVPVGVWGVY